MPSFYLLLHIHLVWAWAESKAYTESPVNTLKVQTQLEPIPTPYT